MSQILFLHKRFTSEPDKLQELFGQKVLQLPHGQAFLSKVDLYIMHADERAIPEVMEHLCSIPNYMYSYGPHSRMLVDDAKHDGHYGGFKWRRLRRVYEFLLGIFGKPFNVYPVKPAKRHSGLAQVSERAGQGRFSGQIFFLGEVPDHKRKGTEDL